MANQRFPGPPRCWGRLQGLDVSSSTVDLGARARESQVRRSLGSLGHHSLGTAKPLFWRAKNLQLTRLRLLYNHMVMERLGHAAQPGGLDALFAALADPTRRAILSRLAAAPASVNEIAAPFEMSQPAVSKHLKVLERAGLIERDVDKQRRPARLKAEPMAAAVSWLEEFKQFWSSSFDQLDGLLEQLKKAETGDRE